MILFASKRNVRRKMCAGRDGTPKKGYLTEDDAKYAAETMRHSGHGTIRHYKCTFCFKWHIGHAKAGAVEFTEFGRRSA
jgi:hypothetical protein